VDFVVLDWSAVHAGRAREGAAAGFLLPLALGLPSRVAVRAVAQPVRD
jgi:hypothetical protein